MSKKLIKVVTIGGGSGHSLLLSGLRDLENVDLTAIVAMSDNGRSNGRLREELGILPVADILKCIIALSPKREAVKDLLLKKFEIEGRLKGFNAGYMMMAQLALFDNFENAVKALGQAMEIKGNVFPITLTRTTLVTELEDGDLLFGEFTIDKPGGFYGENKKIKRNFLVPHHGEKIETYPPAINALENADFVIIGSGGFYNSVTVNLLFPEVKETLQKSSAKIIFISNMSNRFGSEGFAVSDYMRILEKRLGRGADIVIANNFHNKNAKYEKVIVDTKDDWKGKKIIITNFEKSGDGPPLWDESKQLADIIRNCLIKNLKSKIKNKI